MKRIFIIALVITVHSSVLLAQLKINAGAGINISELKYKNFDLEEGVNPATNFFVSVRPELGILERLSLSVDIQLSRKGYLMDSPTVNTPSAYRMQYLDVLPQAQFRFMNAAAIYAGLGVGFRLTEKAKFNDAWQTTVIKFSNKTDVSYLFGIRFFPLDKVSAHIQIAGSLSDFSGIEWTNNVGDVIDVTTKLQNFQLGIAYQIL